MKKFLIGACAALIATVSLASTADAGVVVKYKSRWHRPHAVVVVRPRARVYVAPRRVYVAPRIVIGGGCVVKKRVDAWGNVYKKRIC